ncbi:Transcriptional regulator, GntR family [hydrothermal vent metagenome]|uniref:Transcriptional regulator, GntR family n=1 Tax=hydrothermal vent metagenome TaxID=652676 RepID=A0A3B0TVY3_9ZZZZ
MSSKTEFNIPQIAKNPHLTAHEHTYYRLRNALMVGAIKPGSALKIRVVAQYLGVSPTPVREALRRLSSESALEVLGNRRIVVPTMSEGRFEELIMLRVELECLAAKRALPYVSDMLISKMAAIDTRMDQALDESNYDFLTVLNQQFHELLYTANTDQAVMPLIESVWLQLGPFQRQVINVVMNYYRVDRHKEVLAALGQRDEAALLAATKADIVDGIGRAGASVIGEILS